MSAPWAAPAGGRIPSRRIERTLRWRDLAVPHPMESAAVNAYRVEPEVLPIVFVPGIMGSRLAGPEGLVWDPDDLESFGVNFGLRYAGSRARVQALVGANGYHPHNLWLARRELRYRCQGSWQNLVQAAYGTFGQRLQQTRWSAAMQLCFQMPTYAFAYNWTQSIDSLGLQLKDFIEQVRQKHQSEGLCQKVIVVTHSMGGLVARAAAMLHGADQQMLGVVHAMMPMAGAPAAYLRIKHGFAMPMWPKKLSMAALLGMGKDAALSLFLGISGSTVRPVLGQMPGALALLPNHLYRDGQHRPDWITLAQKPGAEPQDRLPQRADPYEEVYRAQKANARLFDAPPACPDGPPLCDHPSCWQNALSVIDDVEHLHRRLGAKCHPNTFHIVGRGLRTWERAQFLTVWGGRKRELLRLTDVSGVMEPQFPPMRVTDICTGDGDGTVPLSSALTGIEDAATVSTVHEIEHGAAMEDPRVLALVQKRVAQLAHRYISQGLAGEA